MSIINKNNNASNDVSNDVNYACICNKYLKKNLKVVILYPCSHILHSTCYVKTNKKCPFCNAQIKRVIHEDYLYTKINDTCEGGRVCGCNSGGCNSGGCNSGGCKNSDNKIFKQMIINLESTRLDSSTSFINYNILPINVIKFTTFINKLLLATKETDLINCLDYLFYFTNVKINVIDNTKNNPIIYTIPTNKELLCGDIKCMRWQNEVDDNKKKILIVNHSHYIDSFILYYLFRSGFVASEFINKSKLGRLIAQKCKLLIFKRGVDTNMVNKIKEYLEEKKIIVIYPEGSMGSNESIRKFRTGAFYADAHICPVVIKYRPHVWDDDYKTFILKMISQNEIIVDIYINDLHAPPFSTEQIQKIRSEMITMGNMKESHVSNRGFKD